MFQRSFKLMFKLKKKALIEESYNSYKGDDANGNLVRLRRISPLFLFLFILPLVFIYLFFSVRETDQMFKLGLLLFLELSTWFIDLWTKESRVSRVIWIWLIEMRIIFLIFFNLYLSFWKVTISAV